MDRLASDHSSIASTRCRVARHGGRARRIEIPSGILPDEPVVRVVLDETIRYGALTHRPDVDVDWLTGVFDAVSSARAGAPTGNRLSDWLDAKDRSVGSSVLVDEITPEFAIGLRAPGERELYPTIDPPSSSLAAIARSLEDDG